jgi:hypothetical protein
MDPSAESAASLPGVLRELLVGRSTKTIFIQTTQKEGRGSANFGDNYHGTNLDLLTHEPEIDLETLEEISIQKQSFLVRGFQQVSNGISDSYHECTETKMQAQQLEPP